MNESELEILNTFKRKLYRAEQENKALKRKFADDEDEAGSVLKAFWDERNKVKKLKSRVPALRVKILNQSIEIEDLKLKVGATKRWKSWRQEIEREKESLEGELEDAIQANAELTVRIAELTKEIAELKAKIGG